MGEEGSTREGGHNYLKKPRGAVRRKRKVGVRAEADQICEKIGIERA